MPDDFTTGAANTGPAAGDGSGGEACEKRPLVPTGTANCSVRSVRGGMTRGGEGDTRTSLFSMVTRGSETTGMGDGARRSRGGARGTEGSRIILDANAVSGIGCG